MVERYHHYQPRRMPPKRRKKKGPRRVLTPTVAVLLLLIGYRMLFGGNEAPATETPKAATKKKAEVKVEPISDQTWQQLEATVDGLLTANSTIDIGVSMVDIKTGTKVNYGYQEAFHGASTTKILTAAAFLHQVEQGQHRLDEQLSGASAQEHIRLMINRSDNNSWAVLNSAVGYSQLDAYAEKNGINSYKYVGNTMNAQDMALLLYKLYQKQLVNADHTNLILNYMQNTNNEDMIPVVTPSGGNLFHKYGQLDDRLHDVSILEFKNRPLVLVVYTKAQPGQDTGYNTRITMIQQIASSIFETFYANKP